MRGIPDSECPDCKERNGAHRSDCAGRVPCQECGGKYRAHQRGCSRLFSTPEPKQFFKVGDEVVVIDRASPFHNWHGSVREEKPHLMHDQPGAAVIAWYYQCSLLPPKHSAGYDPGAPLTFNQDQLQADL